MKMLRMLVNGQSSIHDELKKLRTEIENVEIRLNKKIDKVDTKLTKRIDALGKQLAVLDDDAPTRDEFEELKKRVDKLQNHVYA